MGKQSPPASSFVLRDTSKNALWYTLGESPPQGELFCGNVRIGRVLRAKDTAGKKACGCVGRGEEAGGSFATETFVTEKIGQFSRPWQGVYIRCQTCATVHARTRTLASFVETLDIKTVQATKRGLGMMVFFCVGRRDLVSISVARRAPHGSRAHAHCCQFC